MRNTLTVYANGETEVDKHVVIRVYWMTGKNRKGVVDVRLPLSCEVRQEAAEAVAIRHLLGDVKILGPNKTGLGLTLVVSKGAIRKMARQSTQKVELYEYGSPLITRYGEAIINVSKDTLWFLSQEELLTIEIPLIDGEGLKGLEKIDDVPMGTVGITFHALERYREYRETRDFTRSWKSLVERLKGDLEKINLPNSVELHKMRKYGEKPEVWKHADDTMHYVFCEQGNMKVLVTVFNRKSDNIPVYRSA